MKTAGVVIDKWKLAIFKRHLDAGDYSYTEHPGVTPDTLILKVKTERVAPLQKVIAAAQLECKSQ